MKKTIQLLRSKWREYLIELIVIIVGILLAIALNEWNANRKDRQKEKQIRQQIHEEFILNKEQLDSHVAFHQNTFNHCKKILDFCPININTVNLDSLQWYIHKIGSWKTYNPTQGTIESLTSTSSFDIISDEKLRMLLIQWKDLVNDYIELERYAVDHLDNIFKPYRAKHFPRNPKKIPHFSLSNSEINLDHLQSYEFSNQVIERMSYLHNILNTGNLKKVQNTIDEILMLSKL